MKKSVKKTIGYLRRYVGHEIIRTKPSCGDWSYTEGEAILLLGFTPDGNIRYCHTGFDAFLLGDEEYVLSICFTDRNWITYKKACKAKGNVLNKWRGKKIKRICPTTPWKDYSYMSDNDAPTLVSASKHHMVIMENDGTKELLNSNYMNLSDWKLVE